MDAPIDVVATVASATEFGSTSTNLDWPLRAGVECHRLVGFVGIGPCAISPLIKAYMEAAQFFKCQKCRGTWKTTTWTITTRSEIKNSFSFFLYFFFFKFFFCSCFQNLSVGAAGKLDRLFNQSLSSSGLSNSPLGHIDWIENCSEWLRLEQANRTPFDGPIALIPLQLLTFD